MSAKGDLITSYHVAITSNAASWPLPEQIASGASLHGTEYGWKLAAFPDALRTAPTFGYACIGGQFQFRIADTTYEMYWLNADATDRAVEETWTDYCSRSCTEVGERFNALAANTDFLAEAANWRHCPSRLQTESTREWHSFSSAISSPRAKQSNSEPQNSGEIRAFDRSTPRKLNEAMNFSGNARFPSLSPDGKYLFFCGDDGNIYWVDTKVIEKLKKEQPSTYER